MSARPSKKLIAFISPLLVFVFFVSIYYNGATPHEQQLLVQELNDEEISTTDGGIPQSFQAALGLPADDNEDDNDDDADKDTAAIETHAVVDYPDSLDYREIFSQSTSGGKFFNIYFGGDAAYNPNIIPHPTAYDMWIVVAQEESSRDDIEVSRQLTCNAGFLNGVLVCTSPPTALDVTPSIRGICEGDLAYANSRFGPRDARVFYGPDNPYIMYGSQSTYTCLGLWLQDARMLLKDFHLEALTLTKLFKQTTELQRPPPHKPVEKNFFLFWDSDGTAYVHHDIGTTRVFAQLSYDGSTGPDLAPLAASKDNVCMAKYMPTPASPQDESIHQATNSLSITMCKRADPGCVPSDANTFIMTIFQHKIYHDFHAVYEPYVMLFHRASPFAVHALSQRPLWIHGRMPLTPASGSLYYDGWAEADMPRNQTEMFYITSMSWKGHGQKYHGYLDDLIFLSFGIEDSRPAAIDLLAADLLQDMALCAH